MGVHSYIFSFHGSRVEVFLLFLCGHRKKTPSGLPVGGGLLIRRQSHARVWGSVSRVQDGFHPSLSPWSFTCAESKTAELGLGIWKCPPSIAVRGAVILNTPFKWMLATGFYISDHCIHLYWDTRTSELFFLLDMF